MRISAKSMYACNMFKISNMCIILSFSHFMKWREQISSHFMKWLEYFSHFMKWLNELAILRNGYNVQTFHEMADFIDWLFQTPPPPPHTHTRVLAIFKIWLLGCLVSACCYMKQETCKLSSCHW